MQEKRQKAAAVQKLAQAIGGQEQTEVIGNGVVPPEMFDVFMLPSGEEAFGDPPSLKLRRTGTPNAATHVIK
jgi:hypothetical protein